MTSPLEQIELRPRYVRGEIPGSLEGDATIVTPVSDQRWRLELLNLLPNLCRNFLPSELYTRTLSCLWVPDLDVVGAYPLYFTGLSAK